MTSKTKILIAAAVILALFFGGFTVAYYKYTDRDGEKAPDYKSLLNDAAKYIGSLEQKQRQLQQSVKAASPDNAEAQSGIKNLTSKTQSLEKENARLRKEISELSALRETAATAEDLKKLNQKLTAEAQAANTARLDYENQNTTLRSAAEKSARLRSEKQQIEKQLQDSRKHSSSLEKEMAGLRSALAQQQKLTVQSKNVGTQLQTCLSNSRQMETKIADLEAIAHKNKALAANNRELEDEVKARDREITEMRTRLEEILKLVSEDSKEKS